MTGCPNGCARSANAEIGFIGTSYGRYNMHLGGDRLGLRLNKLYKEHAEEQTILTELDSLFGVYASDRVNKESFGDFIIRKQLV
jgi:sulfite reductase (NADPH) hemoprotein beta-component